MDPPQQKQSSLITSSCATDEQLVAKISQLSKPKVQIVLSGKRKCGKDFLESLILERFPRQVLSYRISAPIKGAYAQQHGLDFAELLTASEYKEQYRQEMVSWSEAVRAANPHHFLRLAIIQAATQTLENRPIWLLNDARRPTDLAYFADASEIDMTATALIKLRITSSELVRVSRGWHFTAGIDDQQTECGLDGERHWDYIIQNDGTKEDLLSQLEPFFEQIKSLIN
ncbi:hypothetical protein TYRP_017628 [Tyrophagus putrescentiae]|nr:hypothetical protein TYRP_017628 [Tyrophagus putrescentiae]